MDQLLERSDVAGALAGFLVAVVGLLARKVIRITTACVKTSDLDQVVIGKR